MVHVSTHTHIIIQNKLNKCNYSFKRLNQLIQSPFRIIVIDYQLFKFGKVWLLMIHATRLCWQYFPSQGQVNCDVFKKKKNFNVGRREKLITKDCIWSSKVSHCWKTLSPIMDQPGVFPKTGWSPVLWYLSLFGNPVWADTVVNLGWGHIWLG